MMPKIKIRNIFSELPVASKKEVFQVLQREKNFRIERIVSCGQATPNGKWLVDKKHEWVIVLKGRARLLFKRGGKKISLKAGDYLFIPAHTHHRVAWTDAKQKTVWLSVLFSGR